MSGYNYPSSSSYDAQSPLTERRANARAGAAGAQIMSPQQQQAQAQAQAQASYVADSNGRQAAGYTPRGQREDLQQWSPQAASQQQQSQQSSDEAGSFLSAAESAAEQAAVAEALAAGLCICEVCQCGKHHCPAAVHLQARYAPNIESAYRASYPRHPLTVVRARAPPSTVFASNEPFLGASVTKADYSGARGAPATLWKPEQRSTVGGEEGRDFQSENASNYKSHGYARREASIPSHTMHVSNEPFSGESTTRQDYQSWNQKPVAIIRPTVSAAPTGRDERDFATEAGSKFNSKGYVARQPAIPFTSHVFDSEPFAGESSMKDAYKPWSQKPLESFKPKIDPEDKRPDDRQFKTEKQENYTAKPNPGVVRMRAPPSQVLESAPFAGESVTKADYSGHRGAKPATLWKPEQRSTVGGDEGRDFQSENAANYKSHGYARREASIPSHTMHVSNEPFSGESTTRQDYQSWNQKPVAIIRPTVSAAPTGRDERDFATEAGSKFNSKGYVARQPAIPFTSHVFDSEPFAGESSMKDAYKPWSQKPLESFKPKVDPEDKRPDDRLFKTEKQENYTAKPNPGVVRMRAPPSQVLESAPFAGESVTKADYSGHRGAKPATLWKPEQRSTVGGEEGRDFQSENASNYKSHGYARREASIPSHTMHVSNEPFSGESTTRQDYQSWNQKPVAIIRPTVSAAPTGRDERDFATEAGSKFNSKGYVARQPAIPFTSHVFDNSESRDFETESSRHFNDKGYVKESYVPVDWRNNAREQTSSKVVADHLLYHHEPSTKNYLQNRRQ